MTDDKLLTPRQVGEILQVDERTVRRWIDRGLLPGVELPGRGRAGKELRVKQSDLEKFVEERTTQSSGTETTVLDNPGCRPDEHSNRGMSDWAATDEPRSPGGPGRKALPSWTASLAET